MCIVHVWCRMRVFAAAHSPLFFLRPSRLDTTGINPFAALVPQAEMPPVHADPYAEAQLGLPAISSAAQQGGQTASGPVAAAACDPTAGDTGDAGDAGDSASVLSACAAVANAASEGDAPRAAAVASAAAAAEEASRSSSPDPYATMFSPRNSRDDAPHAPAPDADTASSAADSGYSTASAVLHKDSEYATAEQLEAAEEDGAGEGDYEDVLITPEARARLEGRRSRTASGTDAAGAAGPAGSADDGSQRLHASAEGCANALVLLMRRHHSRRASRHAAH